MPLPQIDKVLRKTHYVWDRVYRKLSRKSSLPVTVDAYRGYGTCHYLYLVGRVLRKKHVAYHGSDRGWQNLIKNLRRFNSQEINDAELEIQVGTHSFQLKTDLEGYYRIDTVLNPPLEDNGNNWREYQIKINRIPGAQVNVFSQGYLMIPNNAKLGIISDIDDTILYTDMTSLLKLRALYLTLLKNAGTRVAFRQVSAFYRALKKGKSGQEQNAFFYVSNSPWNLYDLLTEFLDLNDLPKGPVFLRDFGLPYEEKPKNYRGHKHYQITKLLNTYPNLPFVLIGDSGEKDTKVYLDVAKDYPGRIKAIYIRDVLHPRRARRVQKLMEQATDIPIRLVKNYGVAAQHAAAEDLIDIDLFQSLVEK